MRARPASAAVGFCNGDGLAVIEQRLQAACQLLALVVRELGQALRIKRVIYCCRVAFSWGETHWRRTWKMRAMGCG